MNSTVKHIEDSIKNSFSYQEYEALIEQLLSQNKSTTEGFGADFVQYSKLGLQRMQRWDKRFMLDQQQKRTLQNIKQPQTWVVLAEGWCGDAAHSLPIINKLAEANDQIWLRIVLREQNLELMNDFLTNGGKSIPKLIIYDTQNQHVLADWGPRPQPAQELFLQAKNKGVAFEVYEQELQQWYNKDKGQTTTAEILNLLS